MRRNTKYQMPKNSNVGSTHDMMSLSQVSSTTPVNLTPVPSSSLASCSSTRAVTKRVLPPGSGSFVVP